MAPIFAARRTRVEPTLEPGAVAAPADAEQLAQVVRNLLENAARYGREGGTIRLSVARAAPGSADARAARWPARPGVVLAVSDDGPGIARHHLPRLAQASWPVRRTLRGVQRRQSSLRWKHGPVQTFGCNST